MTFPTRQGGGYWTEDGWKPFGKPRLDWLLLAVLTADLGLWVGLLAWWIWR